MILVSCNDVPEGAKLAKPVFNQNGMSLANEGTALTNNMIKKFIAMGVEIVWIVGEKPLSDMEYAQMKEKVIRRFSLVQDDPLLIKLSKIQLEVLEAQKGAGEDAG